MQTIQKTITLPLYSFFLDVSRDDELSRMYYQDFIENAGGDTEVTQLDSYRRITLYIIGDHEKKAFSESFLNRCKKSELVELYHLCFDSSECEHYTKKQMIDELQDVTLADYYKQLWEENKTEEIPYNRASGYCQGDVVHFVTIGDGLEWVTDEYMENLIFNQPLYARLTVVDNLTDKEEEIDLTEFLDCVYNWNKGKVLDHLREYRSDWWLYAVGYCEEHLRDYY